MSLIGQKITVLGAGVAGLAVARALALRGAQVVVLEQAAAVAEVGAGLQVSPNGAVVLDALGLGDALRSVALRAQAVDLRDGVSGNLVTRLEVGRLAPIQGYHFVHRADLIEILRQGAVEAGVELRLGARVLSVSLDGAVPVVGLDSGAQEAGLLIGADGLHSATRAALNGAEVPFFTHQVAWRALIAGDGGPDVAEVHGRPDAIDSGFFFVVRRVEIPPTEFRVSLEHRARWTGVGLFTNTDHRVDNREGYEKVGLSQVHSSLTAPARQIFIGALPPKF